VSNAEITAEQLVAVRRVSSGQLNIGPHNVVLAHKLSHSEPFLQTHIQVIRVLELDQAKLGSEFHYSKRIELDERRKRSDELRQQITANCPK
jgi:hypothetical protein